MSFAIAIILRPIMLFVLLGCICLPARYAVIKWVPEGNLKRFLLREVK